MAYNLVFQTLKSVPTSVFFEEKKSQNIQTKAENN